MADEQKKRLIQIGGRVVNEDGRGIGRAVLQLMEPGNSKEILKETEADDLGYFSMTKIPAGSYRIVAVPEQYKNGQREVEVPLLEGNYNIELSKQ